MEIETAPRERKIRRGIVLISSVQVALGAVIIGMSFTAYASTSSEKIRSASPYWAGFMVLFTGCVGFLTWKQLSIVSIGIYTILSTASVIVSLVATVLTADSADFLKTLNYCTVVKFEHACECCITNATCTSPHKFPSVRNCSLVNGFLRDIMYGLCVTSIVCCVVCLTVSVIGCTLGAQYVRYSQGCGFHWTHPPVQPDYDHRHNWSPYPTDPITNLPPWAPPIYYSVPNTPRGVHSQCGGPPTLFDPVDFPPPYTSREPSVAGRHDSQSSLGLEFARATFGHNGISWDRLGPSVFRFFGQDTVGTVSEDSFDYIDRTNVRDLGSSSGTSEGVVTNDDRARCVFGRNSADEGTCLELTNQLPEDIPRARATLLSSSTESDSEASHDNVFSSSKACTITSHPLGPTNTHGGNNRRLARSDEQVGQRRHSWTRQIRATQSSNVYCAREEIYHAHVAPNVNPWAQSVSLSGPQGGAAGNTPITKQRANSTPCYTADHVMRRHIDVIARENHARFTSISVNDVTADVTDDVMYQACQVDSPTWPEENRSLFRHFTESRSSRIKAHKKRRRPRNNPGHILEQDRSGHKETNTPGTASACTEYRETTL